MSVLLPLLLPVLLSSLVFGLTASIFFANSTSFGLESNWLTCSSSELDLIIIPLLFFVVVVVVVAEPLEAFIGFISMAIDGGLF
jgi:flagellar biosynthesis protein FliQ